MMTSSWPRKSTESPPPERLSQVLYRISIVFSPNSRYSRRRLDALHHLLGASPKGARGAAWRDSALGDRCCRLLLALRPHARPRRPGPPDDAAGAPRLQRPLSALGPPRGSTRPGSS